MVAWNVTGGAVVFVVVVVVVVAIVACAVMTGSITLFWGSGTVAVLAFGGTEWEAAAARGCETSDSRTTGALFNDDDDDDDNVSSTNGVDCRVTVVANNGGVVGVVVVVVVVVASGATDASITRGGDDSLSRGDFLRRTCFGRRRGRPFR